MFFGVDDDVLQLDVSVGHMLLMEVIQSEEKLLEDSLGFVLRELSVWH